MAFRRVIFTSDSKLDTVKQDINRLIDTKNFQIKFPDCKVVIKPSVKPDTLIVDVNGEGADSVAKKLKDLGGKHGVAVKIKTDVKLTPANESKLMKKSEFRAMIKEEIQKILSEEIQGNVLSLYHRTTIPAAKKIIASDFNLIPNDGLIGKGAYFVYDDPKKISSNMDVYGGASLKYSIPLSSLSDFLVFDKNIQTSSIEEQLKKIPQSIIRKLSINTEDISVEELEDKLNEKNKSLSDYFKGVLYSLKRTPTSGFGASRPTGTNKNAVIYDTSLLKFEGISTDGITYKIPTDTKISSPEVQLSKNLIEPNSEIKKTFVNLSGKKMTSLPDGLRIIGSLDLSNTNLEEFPKNLYVQNTLYVDLKDIPKLPNDIQYKRLKLKQPDLNQIKSMEKLGYKYIPASNDAELFGTYYYNGYFTKK
jgi:hypothetical protein